MISTTVITDNAYIVPIRDTTRSTVVIRVNIFQTELMVEIYSMSQVRAISKVLCMKLS